MKPLVYLLGVLFLLPGYSIAQDFKLYNDPGVSLGNSVIDELLPEGYDYEPLTMLGHISIWRSKNLSIYTELQLTHVLANLLPKSDFEFGLNAGIRYQLPLSDRFLIDAAIGSGPHYITINTLRQANGFIFSDNFELGVSYHLINTATRFHLKSRFRHISNAGLQSPNGGIDNLFMIIGFSHALE